MRVGLVIYGSLDTVSGGYLYDGMLVDHLRRKGDEVDIVSLPRRSYLRCLKDNHSNSLKRRLERAKWDVLLQDELNHPSLFRLNQRLCGKICFPIISIVHHLRSCELRPVWKNVAYRQIEKSFLHSVDGFVFNSHTTRSEVERFIGSGKPHVVAYPGRDHFRSSVSPDRIKERAGQPGPLRIVFLGNVIPRKGLHTLLEALSLLPKETWRLEVIGRLDTDPDHAQILRRKINKKGLSYQVKLRGMLPDSEVAERFAESHVLAVPSSYEGLGIVYLEGMGFGLPAIASTTGAARELIDHERDGFLNHPGDFRTLANSIRILHQDRNRLLRMSLSALEKHLSFPTWGQTTTRICRFLKQVVQT